MKQSLYSLPKIDSQAQIDRKANHDKGGHNGKSAGIEASKQTGLPNAIFRKQ